MSTCDLRHAVLTAAREFGKRRAMNPDAGLAYMTGLSNLRTLSLTRTRVTMDGVAELKLALPGLEISRR